LLLPRKTSRFHQILRHRAEGLPPCNRFSHKKPSRLHCRSIRVKPSIRIAPGPIAVPKRAPASAHKVARRKRSALAMTDTELTAIAALASMGLRSKPNSGYATPAAIGTPKAL
jgi:hypothetical protein